jgi:hypothetical protein
VTWIFNFRKCEIIGYSFLKNTAGFKINLLKNNIRCLVGHFSRHAINDGKLFAFALHPPQLYKMHC